MHVTEDILGMNAALGSKERTISFRTWVFLFALALIVRLAHVLAMARSPYFANPVIDAGTFAAIGSSIARGLGYPQSVFWHPPGYPSFLGAVWWLVGDSPFAPRLVQAFLSALSVVLIGRLAERSFGRTVGLASAVGATLYAMLIYFDAELLAPSLAIFLLLATLTLALEAAGRQRRMLWFASGVVGGLTATMVATTLVVSVLLAGCARRRAPWVLLGLAVALAPVTLRNWVRGREFVLISANGGVNFWIGNNPDYDSTVAIRADLAWQRLVDEPVRAGLHTRGEASRYFVRKALTWATSHPIDFARLQLHKLHLLIGGDEIFRNMAIYPSRTVSPVMAALLWKIPGLAFPFGVLLPLALVGLLTRWRQAQLLAALLLLLAMTALAFFITARYRVMMVPFLIIFAAAGAHWLLRLADARRGALALAGATVVFLLANLGQGDMDERMNADAEYSLGVHMAEQGRMPEAQALFESAIFTRPNYVEAWVNLSICHDQAGRPSDARKAFLNAYALDPEGVMTLVSSFRGQGRPEVTSRLMNYLLDAMAAGSRVLP